MISATGRGQAHPPSFFRDELHPERIFKQLDLLTDRAGRDIESARCLDQAVATAERFKNLDRAKRCKRVHIEPDRSRWFRKF